jgi:hypothetical protein
MQREAIVATTEPIVAKRSSSGGSPSSSCSSSSVIMKHPLLVLPLQAAAVSCAQPLRMPMLLLLLGMWVSCS